MNRQNQNPARRSGGFTLIELLVVILIMGILVSILVPTLARMRTQAMVSATRTSIHVLDGAIGLYYSDHKVYPLSGPAAAAGNCTGAANLFNVLVTPFQIVSRGQVYGPYNGADRLNTMDRNYKTGKDSKDGPFVFIDAWNNPILYYSFAPQAPDTVPAKYYDADNSGVKNGSGQTYHPSDINAYAKATDGSYLSRKYLLLSGGPDGVFSPTAISTAANTRVDDISNIKSE